MSNEIVKVPEFTANEYIGTSTPYEWLYQYKDDKFLLRQLCEQMKQQAGSVGVKAFMSLWKAFCEMQAQQQGIFLENSTNFEGQEIELFSGQYICDELGVVIEDKYGYENVICRHPIMPIERLVNIDSGEERLKIAFKKGKHWRSLIVEKSVLASSSAILQLAASGILVNSENAKSLSTYLFELEQLNYEIISEKNSVSRLGWIGEHGFSPYVKNLIFDGENNFKHIFNSVTSKGDFQLWIDECKKVRSERGKARIFLAASFASVLIEPCGLLPFFLHAWGGTEAGKTVGLMLAASVWANPKMGEYISTFNATLVGQEMTASFLNSLPMCIDELQIQSSAGIKEFDKIIYQLTEGVGRTRGAKTGGLQKINTWKNCFITNGEHPLSNSNSGGGAVNRVIEFECDGKIYSDLVGLCNVINSNYGYAGKMFVEYLQTENIIDEVCKIQKDFYRELLKIDSTDKQAASASAILTADKLVTDLIFKDGNNLTVNDMSSIMTKKSDVDINMRAYEFLIEFVVKNIHKFKPNSFGEYVSEVWGKIEQNKVYIIKFVFDREMQNTGFNPVAFLSYAKRLNLIETDFERRTKRTRISGTLTNCVCLINLYEIGDLQEKIEEIEEIEI